MNYIKIVKLVVAFALGCFVVLWLVPIFGMITNSLKDNIGIFLSPWGFPENPQWENFPRAWIEGNLARAYINSGIIVSSSVALIILISSLAAYAISTFEFKGRMLIFYALLATMMIPVQMKLIPIFVILRNLGLMNKPLGLIIVYQANIGFPVLMLTAFFTEISKGLKDAARIDGCSSFRFYWSILLPLSKPAVSAVTIFMSIWHWNDFLFPYVLLRKQESQTLTLAIYNFKAEHTIDWGLTLAAISLAMLPVIGIYLVFQKQFIKGMTAGTFK